MAEILKDAAGLLAAMEANYLAYARYFAQAPYMEWYSNGEMTWLVSRKIPYWNAVLRTNITGGDVGARIEAMIAYFKAVNMSFTWKVLPSTLPADMGRYLEAYGLQLVEREPHMALDLLTLGDVRIAQPGLAIELVSDLAGFNRWYQATVAGFGMVPPQAQIYFDVYTMFGFDPRGPFLHYTGYLHGEPVTSSTLLMAEGIAGVYDVSTVPAVRGRGLGTMITLAPLLEAKARGYRYACLQSTVAGYNVYRRIGFEEMYRGADYRWRITF